MAGRATQRPRAVSSLAVVQVDDVATDHALQTIADAVNKLQTTRDRDAKTVDLIVGTNRVRHGLGRPVLGYTITPTFATIAFGHAINTANPSPELEVWIDVLGSDQAGARVEIF